MKLVIYDNQPDNHHINNNTLISHVHLTPGKSSLQNVSSEITVAAIHVSDFQEHADDRDSIKGKFKKLCFYSGDEPLAITCSRDYRNYAETVIYVPISQLSKGLRDAVLISNPELIFENYLPSALNLLSALYSAYIAMEINVLDKPGEVNMELNKIENTKTSSGIPLGSLHNLLIEKSHCTSPLPCMLNEFVDKLTIFRDDLLAWAAK